MTTFQIESNNEALHPWALAPSSVGALSMTQIGALASTDDVDLKERIRVAGAIPMLVRELSNSLEDRSDAALVALSFLSISSKKLDFSSRFLLDPKACIEMYEANIFSPLTNLLKKPKDGVRAAAAQTARNIFVLEPRYRRAFRDVGGHKCLVDLLNV